MCLTIKGKLITNISKDDITVYVIRCINKFGKIESPYNFETLWNVGQINKLNDIASPHTFQKSYLFGLIKKQQTYIYEGSFHVHVSLKNAIKHKKIYEDHRIYNWGEVVIFKATIPKGTNYIEGIFNKQKSIACQSLRLDEIVK